MPSLPIVHYFTIKNSSQKLSTLVDIAAMHIYKKKPLHILVADKTTQNFVSELLWKGSKESFLPHSLDPQESPFHLICIHLPKASYDEIETIFNLTAQALSNCPDLCQIYEYEDLSHPNKKQIFEKKFKLYQDAGYTLCSN